VRFSLNEQLDKKLIARIKEKSGGSSTNEAARFLFRYWHELELRQNLTCSGQKLPAAGQDASHETTSKDVNLSGLDSIFIE
jgi:hypothetical protein